VYLHALHAALFLSADERDVLMALEAGIPAARVYAKPPEWRDAFPQQVRIAFDGDSVLFADEAERVYREQGLQAFHENERMKAHEPLPPGPFKPFLEALHRLQSAAGDDTGMSIRTALVTARDAPAHDRAVRTLMSWNVQVNEAFFLGGLRKAEFLEAFQPDFFFDDQLLHCDLAAPRIPTGHVAYGVANISRVR
jgi:5'-nucleotidase